MKPSETLSNMRMRRVAAAAASILLPSLLPPSAAASASDRPPALFLEPVVKRHAGILPPHVCSELMRLGEEEGFTVEEESIDADVYGAASSQSIEVYERYARDDGVITPDIWEALEPWIPKLTELVRESIDPTTDAAYFPDKPDRVPQLGWVFFRKYSPDSDRKSLKLHVDSNMHTLNIALNHDFEGGGLFYVKPPADQVEETYDDRPNIPLGYQNYDWLDALPRKNTSDVVFPALEGGDVLIHNFTVWHAVAPIERGTRYSFVLFYDMDNPAIQSDFEGSDEEEEVDFEAVPVAFYHEIEDVEIDLVFVDEEEEGSVEYHMIEEKMAPFETVDLHSYEGHVFRALISGTEEEVAEFVVGSDRAMFTIERGGEGTHNDPNDEL